MRFSSFTSWCYNAVRLPPSFSWKYHFFLPLFNENTTSSSIFQWKYRFPLLLFHGNTNCYFLLLIQIPLPQPPSLLYTPFILSSPFPTQPVKRYFHNQHFHTHLCRTSSSKQAKILLRQRAHTSTHRAPISPNSKYNFDSQYKYIHTFHHTCLVYEPKTHFHSQPPDLNTPSFTSTSFPFPVKNKTF